jgi:hypothetical protein
MAGERGCPPASVGGVDQTLDLAPAVVPPRSASPLDLRMRRLLRLPVGGPTSSARAARSAFQASVYISAARCLLTYIILPFVFPIIGVTTRATPAIGISVSLVAIVADVASIRRFWRADHKYRWHYTALAGAIICAMVVLIVTDTIKLLT